jgi:Listeria-Bacteroides repeat domain (List_Bact_rpt)
VPTVQTKTYGVSLSLATNTGNLVKTGATFAGWNTAADGSGTTYATGSAYTANVAVVLYAKWTLDTYAVTYDANGATGGTAPAMQTKTYGVNLTLATNSGSLVKTGSTFAGWNTAANGSGTTYASGASYTANAAVTLYAVWQVTDGGGGGGGGSGGGGGGGCGLGSGLGAMALALLLAFKFALRPMASQRRRLP